MTPPKSSAGGRAGRLIRGAPEAVDRLPAGRAAPDFGSRGRGSADPESDFDLCVVLPVVTRELRERIYGIAWEIGFDAGRVLAPVLLSEEDFERAPLSASTLVANIRREGIAA